MESTEVQKEKSATVKGFKGPFRQKSEKEKGQKIMLAQTFDQLELTEQFRKKLVQKKNLKIIAYDTETANGLCQLIYDSQGHVEWPCSFDDVLEFFFQEKNRASIGFFFNLKYDFQAILKWLPSENWEVLFHTGELEYENYEIKYIPKKFLMIRRYIYKEGKRRTEKRVFYDIAQFFRSSLDKAGEKYIGMRKLKHTFDMSKLQMVDFKSFELCNYCLYDAIITEELARHWIKICNDMELYPSNFCSSASISSRYFLEKVKIPTINCFFEETKKPYLEIIWEATSGALISVFKRGYFEKVYEYDINSSYPSQIAKLPDVSKGYYVPKKGEPPKNAYLGWLRCKITITPDSPAFYFPCIPMSRPTMSNYYPVGNMETSITLLEYEYLKEYFTIEPLQGIYWIPDKLSFLFADTINDLYTLRKSTTDENINFFIKIVLNGFFGKFLEKHQCLNPDHELYRRWITGQLFNPMYGSYILAGARIELFKALQLTDPKNLVACFTDSILTKKPLNIPLSKDLGTWDFCQEGEAVIIGCGVYTIRGKKLKSKLRGFHITEKAENSLFEIIKKQYKNETIKLNITKNIAPLSAIIQKRTLDMNLLVDDIKEITLNFDTKRLWHGSFKNAGELLEKQYDSFPLMHQ